MKYGNTKEKQPYMHSFTLLHHTTATSRSIERVRYPKFFLQVTWVKQNLDDTLENQILVNLYAI